MKKYFILILVAIAIVFFVDTLPSFASATEGSGLVQCGVDRDCTLCDMFILVRDVFNFVLGLLGMIGVVSIVIGGVYMVISSGNPGMYQQGVQIIVNAVLGLILASSSFLIFGFGLQALGFQEQNFTAVFSFESGSFFEIQCDNASAFNDRGGWGRGGTSLSSGTSSNTAAGQCQTQRCGDVFAAEIKIAADAEGIDPKLLQALIDTENANGTNCATDKIRNEDNGTRSCGLFQLNTGGVASNCGITCEQALNVNTNLRCAASELKRGNINSACSAANRWNPGACGSGCQDLNYTYCSRTVSAYDFYNQCSAAGAETDTESDADEESN